MVIFAKVRTSYGVPSLDRPFLHSLCVPVIRVPCMEAAHFARCALAAFEAALMGFKDIIRQAAAPQDLDLSGRLAVPYVSGERSKERDIANTCRAGVRRDREPTIVSGSRLQRFLGPHECVRKRIHGESSTA